SKERDRMLRSFVRALSIGILATVIAFIGSITAAQAQGSDKVYRIGWIGVGRPPTGTNSAAVDFQQGLRDLGYVIDQNIVIDYRYVDGNTELLPALTSVRGRKVDVIVVAGEPAALAAKRATRTVPII